MPAAIGMKVRTEGDEAPDDEGATAVVREVVLGLLQVLGLEEARVRLEEAAPPLGTQEVADLSTHEGGNHDQEDQGRQVNTELVVQQAGGEEQRLARKDREQDTRLDKNNEHRAPQDPRTHRVKKGLRILKPLDNCVKHRRIRCFRECRPCHDKALFCREYVPLTLPLLTANIGWSL